MPVKRHIVTAITLLRVVSALLIIVIARSSHWLAIVVLTIAAFISDYIDGRLARHWKVVSPLGAFLDPLADKIVCLTILAILAVYANTLYWLPFAIFAAYDIFTITLRLMLARTQSLPTSHIAKWKTATLMVGLVSAILAVADKQTFLGVLCVYIGTLTLTTATVLTVISALGYLRFAIRIQTTGWLEHAKGVTSIDFRKWHTTYGITTVLFDVEGTLTEWGGATVQPDITKVIRQAKDAGIEHIGLVSNMHQRNQTRMDTVARQISADTTHVPHSHREHKPSAVMVYAALENLGASPEHTAFVGDKLVDVLAGSRAGLARVAWVEKLPGSDHPIDQFLYRPIEHALKWFTK